MTVMVVPAVEEEGWPTLGPQVCSWMTSYLVHGPGDLRGQPAQLDAEWLGLLYRMYEVQPQFVVGTVAPQGHHRSGGVLPAKRGGGAAKRSQPGAAVPLSSGPLIKSREKNPLAGRRRFKRVVISLRKGSAKTELASWVGAAELHPRAPVRCDGFDAAGEPVGRGVTDPYIPMVAYTEEQTEDLAYAALYVVLSEGPLARDFDIGLERIMRVAGDGKAQPLASAPNARDGARTTFQHFDETHRFFSPRLIEAHKTMLNNIPKRFMADPWTLETTTAFSPGEGSVAEKAMTYARKVLERKTSDSTLFFFHRQASETHDLSTREGQRAYVVEASGPKAGWSDIDGICNLLDDPDVDLAYWERMWGNRPTQASAQAFDRALWDELAAPETFEHGVPPDGSLIVAAFDGSRYLDSTALIGTHVESGYQWPIGMWEKPPRTDPDADRWEVPVDEVDASVAEMFRRWNVWRLYADPPFWETQIDAWAGKYGEKVVIKWWTNRLTVMAYAVSAFTTAMKAREVSHAGDARVSQHIGNACRHVLNFRDERGERLYKLSKDRSDSEFKIDAAVTSVISWEARGDAIAKGALQESAPSVYDERAKGGGPVLRTL